MLSIYVGDGESWRIGDSTPGWGPALLVALVSATRMVLACRLVSGVHHAALESLFLVLTTLRAVQGGFGARTRMLEKKLLVCARL
jgi:hypothetical protein